MTSGPVVDRMLEIMREDILPLTRMGVDRGNKIFGAAILAKKDLRLVVAGSNAETVNPLFHGEISCLNRFWATPGKERPRPVDCLFLSTHEPCSLCLSAITWSGFDNFYYFFPYEDSRDAFHIPHDLNILKELFRCENGNYASPNAYWTSYCLIDLIEQGPEEKRRARSNRAEELRVAWTALSEIYQEQKDALDIPLP